MNALRIKKAIESTGLILLGMVIVQPSWTIGLISGGCFLYCTIYDSRFTKLEDREKRIMKTRKFGNGALLHTSKGPTEPFTPVDRVCQDEISKMPNLKKPRDLNIDFDIDEVSYAKLKQLRYQAIASHERHVCQLIDSEIALYLKHEYGISADRVVNGEVVLNENDSEKLSGLAPMYLMWFDNSTHSRRFAKDFDNPVISFNGIDDPVAGTEIIRHWQP